MLILFPPDFFSLMLHLLLPLDKFASAVIASVAWIIELVDVILLSIFFFLS